MNEQKDRSEEKENQETPSTADEQQDSAAETRPLDEPLESYMDSTETIPLAIWEEEPEEVMVVQREVVLEHTPSVKVAQLCHVGATRERNDDSVLVFQSQAGGHFNMMPFGLYVVADGMGGHTNGHIASKAASRAASSHILSEIYLPLLKDTAGGSSTPIQEVLETAGKLANTAVYEIDPDSDSGTTLTGALLLGRRLYITHVGDSRAYLFADDKLQQLTIDHSLVQRLQEVGQLTEEEAAFYQYRNVLLRAIGQTADVEIDTYMRRLPAAGRLLLCSDGLCGMINDAAMQEILMKGNPLDETVNELFQAAIDAGGYDNITVILVDFAF